MWTLADIQVDFDLEASEAVSGTVTFEVTTPDGVLKFLAYVREEDNRLELRGLHIQSEIGLNGLGWAKLARVARIFREEMGYDEIYIEGAARTTGSRPGRTPRPIRIRSRSGPAA